MKKITFLFLGGLLALSTAACGAAKTSSNAPDTTAQNNPAVDKPTAQTNQNDAVSETRRKQLNADIQAREQRNKVAGDPNVRNDNDLKSEVRSKLEANLPASALAVDAKDGKVTVSGTVVDENQLRKIGPLAREIKGVKAVEIKAGLSKAAKPDAPKPETANPIKENTNKN
ncbi:MAG: BON domain-containing protein [Phormidium tanganyikae FI6-MK23]|jgi:phage/plasmid-associated DNA primase|nr:BON domain-containing protein [Phormidium tanganyikae FI6-MK23]